VAISVAYLTRTFRGGKREADEALARFVTEVSGELCALRWSDLDMKTGALTISRSIVETQGSTLIEKDTKTHSSRRIALDSGSMAALALQRNRCQRRAESCGVKLSDSAHVLSGDPAGGRPWVPNEVTKQFIRIRRSVSIQFVFTTFGTSLLPDCCRKAYRCGP
jgi:integrase